MVIDIHNHPDWHGHDLADFVANMDACGIDRTVLLSWEAPEDEWDPATSRFFSPLEGGPVPFSRCMSYAEREPERFLLGYCPDPRRPGAVDRLRAAVAIYKVKVCGELKLRMMYDNPDAIRLYRYCGGAGLPVTVHIDYELDTGRDYPRPSWWYGGGIVALERALALCPDTVFLGHAPGFWAHISGDDQFDKVAYPTGAVQEGGKLAELLRRYPNLYCDISGGSGRNALTRDPAFAKGFLSEFQDRVCYGRDGFDNLLQEFLEGVGLPRQVLEKVYYKNAQRIIAGL